MITFMHGISKQPNFQALGACLLKVLACVSSIEHAADAGDLALPPAYIQIQPQEFQWMRIRRMVTIFRIISQARFLPVDARPLAT